MRILSLDEYSYYKEALKESKVLVEDVYSHEPYYNLRGISPMIAAVFLRVTDILNKEKKEWYKLNGKIGISTEKMIDSLTEWNKTRLVAIEEIMNSITKMNENTLELIEILLKICLNKIEVMQNGWRNPGDVWRNNE